MLATPDQDVIVCVCDTIYIGTITFATEKYINIDCLELKTSKTISTKFYKNEVIFIKPLKQCLSTTAVESCDFTLEDFKRMSKLLSNCTFIERFDRDYHLAIEDISSESFIGFYMPGVENGRFSNSSVISIATSTSIYIFDLQVLGRIEKSIKDILEANVPKKIIHDSSRCADNLKKNNVNLSGVFDTMVDVYISPTIGIDF